MYIQEVVIELTLEGGRALQAIASPGGRCRAPGRGRKRSEQPGTPASPHGHPAWTQCPESGTGQLQTAAAGIWERK